MDITLLNMNNISQKGVPLGSLYLTSFLESKGFSVDFRDYQLNSFKDPYDPKKFVSFMKNSSDVIGISVSDELLPFVLLCLRELKAKFPEKKIILGGPGVAGVEENLLKNFNEADIIARGEGELTIVDLLDSLQKEKDLRYVKGIFFKDKGNVAFTGPRKRIVDLDELPFPACHKIKLKKYNFNSLMTSRGCRFNCTFCNNCAFWSHQITARSPDNVIEEIKLIASKSKKCIRFNDDNFLFDRKRVLSICEKIKKEKLDVDCGFSANLNCMDSKLMKKLIGSGFITVLYGVESASDKILRRINKPFNFALADKVIKKSADQFKLTFISFIWGFPFESVEDLKKSVFYMNAYKYFFKERVSVHLSLLSPVPLSALYFEFKHLLRFSGKFIHYANNDTMLNECNQKTKKEIMHLIKKFPLVFPDFYYYSHKGIYDKQEIVASLSQKRFKP
ncbi:MAG: radical SAM protein [archaeon]